MNSRQKGKRGELYVAHFLKDYGYDAKRGQQYAGINGDADVVGLPGVHIEVKFVEKLDLQGAYAQSARDARPGEIPVVFHKKSYKTMLVTMAAEDFMELYGGWKA